MLNCFFSNAFWKLQLVLLITYCNVLVLNVYSTFIGTAGDTSQCWLREAEHRQNPCDIKPSLWKSWNVYRAIGGVDKGVSLHNMLTVIMEAG